MSDYNGPTEPVRVRFTRDWEGVKAGTVMDATYYPELKSYYVKVHGGQHIGRHPNHIGLLEEEPKENA